MNSSHKTYSDQKNDFGTNAMCTVLQPSVLKNYEYEFQREKDKCEKNNCAAKGENNKCDEECNTMACNFDNGDCSLGIRPWNNCTAKIDCSKVFMDGHCDEECNNAQCSFDGRDCEKRLLPCK